MYLIDGNNVIGQRAKGYEDWHRDKAGARRRLLDELALLARAKKLRLTVVFDGAPDMSFPDGSSRRGVKVFYARAGADADARIVELVEAEANKKNLIVVTSDRQLAARVRVCGVRVLRAGELRRMLDEAHAAPIGNDEVRVAEEATDEWLRYFGVGADDDE
jgi:predicted RNA-binding protein with PIN domain